MKKLLAMALVGLVGCGAREEQNAAPADDSKVNMATWTDTAKGNIAQSCIGTRTDLYMNNYCLCTIVALSKMMPYDTFKSDPIAAVDQLKASGSTDKCVSWAQETAK